MWEEKLAFFDKLVATNDKFIRKGKTVPCTTANGYMFSQLNKDGEIGIRLSKASGKAFIEKYNSGPFKSYGSVMRDYVLIPEELYDNMELLAELLEEAYQNVMAMPPK